MKILLDENIDVKFKTPFPADDHQVYTVRDRQWSGTKNGALLKLIQENQFDCWVVADKNLPYQQNIASLPCIAVVLDVFRNTFKHISPLIAPKLISLQNIDGRKVIVISE